MKKRMKNGAALISNVAVMAWNHTLRLETKITRLGTLKFFLDLAYLVYKRNMLLNYQYMKFTYGFLELMLKLRYTDGMGRIQF